MKSSRGLQDVELELEYRIERVQYGCTLQGKPR